MDCEDNSEGQKVRFPDSCRSSGGYRPIVSWAQQMKGGAHPSLGHSRWRAEPIPLLGTADEGRSPSLSWAQQMKGGAHPSLGHSRKGRSPSFSFCCLIRPWFERSTAGLTERVGARCPLYLRNSRWGRDHPCLFAALSYPDLKEVPIYCWADRESFPFVWWLSLAEFELWNFQGLSALIITKYSLIQMKCQGGNKYALSITVKFDQSTRRFGRISFARLFELTKHIALLFYLLSPYLLSCMRGSRNVRKKYTYY